MISHSPTCVSVKVTAVQDLLDKSPIQRVGLWQSNGDAPTRV